MITYKKYFFWVIMCLLLFWMVLGTATLIIVVPKLHEGFETLYKTQIMNWSEVKILMTTNYIIALPLSLLFGFIIITFNKE